MASPADDLQATLPSYAELTQTQGWAPPGTGIAAPAGLVATPAGVRYEETDVLGVGGMGKVVLARDARIGRSVALKVLRTDRPIPAEDQARFLREAQVQGQLEHPSIVPVYDIVFENGALTVRPQMTDLPRGVVTGFHLIAHVAMALK